MKDLRRQEATLFEHIHETLVEVGDPDEEWKDMSANEGNAKLPLDAIHHEVHPPDPPEEPVLATSETEPSDDSEG